MTSVVEVGAKGEGVYYPRRRRTAPHARDGRPSRLSRRPTTSTRRARAWVCLQFTRSALRKAGIFVKDEEALPVGDKPVSGDWLEANWVCPHVIGGIPVAVVEKEYPMTREGNKYVAIEGIC